MKSSSLLRLFVLLLIFSLSFDCSKKLTDQELLELAQRENSRGNPEKAVSLYEELIRIHPDSEYSPMALFMIAYINANELGNHEKARNVYKEFLEKYPDNELVSSVNFELKNMGKSPDELIK
ncbi:MAG: tetratricopeptide repeat protein [Candidatus Helarchaeota archaeon]|nr:tetratricopeptide repeat protein [Candidatus Helarchaeota archaeon]